MLCNQYHILGDCYDPILSKPVSYYHVTALLMILSQGRYTHMIVLYNGEILLIIELCQFCIDIISFYSMSMINEMYYSLTGLAVAVPCHIHLPALVSSIEAPLSSATPDSVWSAGP